MYFEPLSNDQLKEIYTEHNTNEEQIKKDVQHLIQWLEKQPHLPNVTDEHFLTSFLLQCKNSVERTKKKLDQFYVARAQIPEIFSNYNPCDRELASCMQRHNYIILPKLTPEGNRVGIYRIFPSLKQEPVSTDLSIRFTAMHLDSLFGKDLFKSCILIYDMQHVDINMILLYFALLKKIIVLTLDASPLRPAKIYVLNIIPAFERVINFAKSLMSKKIADRIEVWSNERTQLVEVLPKEILPAEYGGTEKSIAELNDLYIQYWKENRDWFLSLQNVVADLSKLPKEHEHSKEFSVGSIEGTFRTISID